MASSKYDCHNKAAQINHDGRSAAEQLVDMLEKADGPFEISQDLLYTPSTTASNTPEQSTPRDTGSSSNDK